MDTRDTPEQVELRRAAHQLAGELGPRTVVDLDDETRAKRLAVAVHDAGWLELRDDRGDGEPLAGGVEVAIVAEGLAQAVGDVAFGGPILAADLARRCGAPSLGTPVVAYTPDLLGVAVLEAPVTTAALHVVDLPSDAGPVCSLVRVGGEYRLAQVRVDAMATGAAHGADLTRSTCLIPPGATVVEIPGQRRTLTDDDLAAWTTLGLALTSADLVGLMRGVLNLAVAYAAERRQFGVPVGSFQAVQHLLADAHCLMEGSTSVALHASWAVDNLPPADARTAGRIAKAYCGRAARSVCETAVQVHGGIGNTWECLVHVFLRRAALSSYWFGDDGEQLRQLERERLETVDGLS